MYTEQRWLSLRLVDFQHRQSTKRINRIYGPSSQTVDSGRYARTIHSVSTLSVVKQPNSQLRAFTCTLNIEHDTFYRHVAFSKTYRHSWTFSTVSFLHSSLFPLIRSRATMESLSVQSRKLGICLSQRGERDASQEISPNLSFSDS